ncbi:MAG: DMT family transporter [Bacteroidia bacterium]|nr:DMT family transporter [Bacteroidia bacterium]
MPALNSLSPSPSEHRRGIAAILAAAVLWSSSGLFIKVIDLPPVEFAGWRSLFAALAFALIFRLGLRRVNLRAWINALLYCGSVLTFVQATRTTTAANAILLQYTSSIYILLAEPRLLGTRLRQRDVIAVAGCMAGMLLLVLEDLGGSSLQGNLTGLLSGVLMAAFVMGQRLNSIPYQPAGIFLGNVLLAVLGISISLMRGPAPWEQILIVAPVGFIQLGLAYGLFVYSLRRIRPLETMLLAMVEPILNPVWVLIGYGERPGSWAIAGGGLILLALAWRAAGPQQDPNA